MWLTLLAFVFVFTVITLVHEFGHLLFTKRAGIRVHEFGVGFGPTLFSWQRNHTIYRINLLPILGYVKIAGIDADDPQEKDTPPEEKYYNKPVFAKFMPIFAGPLMNLLLGFLIFSFVFACIGIPTGVSNEIASISPGSEAAKVGLKVGDRLISINGKTFAKPEDAVSVIHQSPGKTLTLRILRETKELDLQATPVYHPKMKMGLIGFSLKALQQKVNVFSAVCHGAKETLGLSLAIVVLFGRLLVGQLALGDLAGPIGIAQVTGQYAQSGFFSLLNFLAFFSINVAVFNLLPIPALDGGRLVFILIEAVFRKPVNIELENKIHYYAFIAFLGLIVLVTVNDLLRVFR